MSGFVTWYTATHAIHSPAQGDSIKRKLSIAVPRQHDHVGIERITCSGVAFQYEFGELMCAGVDDICLLTRDQFQNMVLNASAYTEEKFSKAQLVVNVCVREHVNANGCWEVWVPAGFTHVTADNLLDSKNKRWRIGKIYRRPKPGLGR